MLAKSLKLMSLLVMLSTLLLLSGSTQINDAGTKLVEWRQGVWISGSGTYTIYTDDHYFVLSYEGDSMSANLYFGASQTKFCSKGLARKQVIRFRQVPGRDFQLFKNMAFQSDHTEPALEIDTTQFTPGSCNIKDGIIYDSITEETDEYILLATCNGDREKIFNNGVSVYMPAGGGEYYSYRIEKLVM